MVRVHHCYRFVSQKVFSPSSEPTRGLSATADGLVLVATADRRVQIFRILPDRVDPIGGFSTISRATLVQASDVLDYAVTLEEKSFQTFVRVYFGWRRRLEEGQSEDDDDGIASPTTSIKLAIGESGEHNSSGSSNQSSETSPSLRRPAGLEIVEVSLKDHASSVATCPISGDIGVAVNRSVYLYAVEPIASSSPSLQRKLSSSVSPMVSLKFILNLDQVASEVTLSHPFVGVVYATAEVKVFRIHAVDDGLDDIVENSLRGNPMPGKAFVAARNSRTRRPRLVAEYDLRHDGSFRSGRCEKSVASVTQSRVIHLRRPNADYAAVDAPTSSLPNVVLKPAVAQERKYEGTENFDMIDLETLEGFHASACGTPDYEDDAPCKLVSSEKTFKPSLCLYKSFKDHPLPHSADASSLPGTTSKMAFFRRADTPDSLFCLAAGAKEGYLYSLPLPSTSSQSSHSAIKDGRRARLLATYPFTSPPLGFSSDGVVLHALTDNGLETFPCRSYAQTLVDAAVGHRVSTSDEDREAAKAAFPPEEVSLLGLASFIGVSGVTFSAGHVVLLSKSVSADAGNKGGRRSSSKTSVDDSWSLYALKEASIVDLHGEMTTLAKRYKRVSLPIYANLLRESLFLLLSAGTGKPRINNAVDEVLEAATTDALTRCFLLNAEEAFDPIAARALLLSLRRRVSFDQLLKHCYLVRKTIKAKENAEENSERAPFIRRMIVDLCQRQLPRPLRMAPTPFPSQILDFIVASHVETGKLEDLATLACVGFLEEDALWNRSNVLESIEKAVCDKESVCSRLLLSSVANSLDVTQIVEGIDARHLVQKCSRHAAIIFRASKEHSKTESVKNAPILSRYGRLLMQHRPEDLSAIFGLLLREHLIDAESLIAMLSRETTPDASSLMILERLRDRVDDKWRLFFSKALLSYYFRLWENESPVRGTLANPKHRPSWLDRLPPFNGVNPKYAPCRKDVANSDDEPDECPCELCNAALLRLQSQLADPQLESDDFREFESQLFPTIGASSIPTSAKLRTSLSSLRVIYLFSVDFRRGIELLRDVNADVLISHSRDICGEVAEKWNILLTTMADEDADGDGRGGEENETGHECDVVLEAAATCLDTKAFLAVLPPDANLRYVSRFIVLNRKLDRVRKCLAAISTQAATSHEMV